MPEADTSSERLTRSGVGRGEIKMRNMMSGTRGLGEIRPLGQKDRHPNRVHSKACQYSDWSVVGGICESTANCEEFGPSAQGWDFKLWLTGLCRLEGTPRPVAMGCN